MSSTSPAPATSGLLCPGHFSRRKRGVLISFERTTLSRRHRKSKVLPELPAHFTECLLELVKEFVYLLIQDRESRLDDYAVSLQSI